MGRAVILEFAGAAAALGNDLRPRGKGTHTSNHLRADSTALSSFLTPSISSRKRLGQSRTVGWYILVPGLTWCQHQSRVSSAPVSLGLPWSGFLWLSAWQRS